MLVRRLRVWPRGGVVLFLFLGSLRGALSAPVRRLAEMLGRWPRYLYQGPAGEMWSVVHFPGRVVVVSLFVYIRKGI